MPTPRNDSVAVSAVRSSASSDDVHLRGNGISFDQLRQRLGRAAERYPDAPAPSGQTAAEPGTGALSSWWVTVAGAALAAGGAVVGMWGLSYLRGALSPDNRSNPLREIGVVTGVGAASLAALAFLCGVGLVWISARRRRASPSRSGRPRGSRAQ
jgi:hypothetical protein